MQIILQPVMADIEHKILHELANDISKEFKNIKVNVGSSSIQPGREAGFQDAFDASRNQWNSPKLLQVLSEKFNPGKESKILVIVDADAYSYGLNFVFGEAIGNGGIAVIYLPRIRQEFYGLNTNEQLFYQRMVKESVHELGPSFGLAHCNKTSCIMHFSNSLRDTDIKARRFCDSCNCKWSK